jgi:hypothetical protein
VVSSLPNAIITLLLSHPFEKRIRRISSARQDTDDDDDENEKDERRHDKLSQDEGE